MRDPWPYDGPIERADGARPFNCYLWPLAADGFWARENLADRTIGHWHFSVVALADGRWSTTGFVSNIERDDDDGRRAVFPTRPAALRASAARLIHGARHARAWPRPDGLTEVQCTALVAWARQVVARETGSSFRPLTLRPLPVPTPKTGLPLFDAGAA